MPAAAAASTSSSAAALLVNRFVSASSSDDIRESLQTILDSLKSKAMLGPDVWTDTDALEALLQVLSTASYKDLPVEEGPVLVAQILLTLLNNSNSNSIDRQSSILLKEPQPGRLVATLLDCIGDLSASSYTRVLCLQLLTRVCAIAPSVAQTQLLEVPNGLHRLAQVLQDADASVRNEALLVGSILASWPSCAKVWVFGDVCDVVMQLAVEEGGLTGAANNAVIGDCLELVRNLLRHDAQLCDLVWQSPVFARHLSQLLDLRKGSEWLHPKPASVSDDLDDIISSGKTPKDTIVVPKLTSKEEDLLKQVLGLLEGMLGSEKIRASVWRKHIPLSSLVWELALISPPPPGVNYVCAMPSAGLQQLALEHVAQVWNSPNSMDRHNGLDRLMFIVCTGGAPDTFKGKLGLSQAALHVLRETLPPDRAKEIVMHSLAPPMETEGPPSPTCVQKLLNTVLENVSATDHLERRKINLSGSLGALGVFLRDSTSREMILQMTLAHSLIDQILQSLESQDDTIALSLVRFLCEWVVETPIVVQALLSSTHSTCLSLLFSKKNNTSILTGLLLGMCMEYMIDDPEKNGGWTRDSILNIIQKGKGGLSGFLSQLESFKKEDLLWKASPVEWKGFLQWYSTQVLVVRRRVVQALAGGQNDEDEEATSSTTVSSKSLQQLVSQQSQELDEMRASLAEAQLMIADQEKQMQIWQRRVESTPTQLDDMLSEFTKQNQDLESKVSELRTEINTNKEFFLAELKGKEDETTVLAEKLAAAEAREQEAVAEQEALRGEMEGLSSAYTNLEMEFHSSRVPEAREQPQGEISSQENGSELDAVRADNARLRADARAADDWMQMAVQRMNDIGGQNLALQQEVAALTEQLTHTVSADMALQLENEQKQRQSLEAQLASETETLRAELEQEKYRRQSVETQLASVQSGESAADAALQQELEEEKRKCSGLELQLANSQQDVIAAMDNLGYIKTEREELSRKLENLQTDLTIASAEATSLREAHRQLEMQLQVAGLEGEAHKSDSPSAEEIDSLRNSVQSLQDQLIRTQADMEAALLRERTEIDTRDEIIRGLEAKESLGQPLSSISDSSGDPKIKARDDEISQLRIANEAAQEWMAKAVEHHTMLSEQVSALSNDKEALKRELREVRGTMSTMKKRNEVEVSMEEHIQMETDLAEKTAELQDAELELDEMKAKLQFAEEELSAQRSISHASQSASDEVLTLKTQMLERDQHVRQLQADIDLLEKEGESTKGSIAKLEKELAESRASHPPMTENSGDVESLQSQLQDATDRVAVLEAELSEILQDKAAVQQLLDRSRDELQQKALEISERTAEVEATKQATSSELSNLKVAISQREQDISRLRAELAEYVTTKEDNELLKNELVSATDDNVRLKAEIDLFMSNSASVNEGTEALEQLEALRKSNLEALEAMTTDLANLKQDNITLSEDLVRKKAETENLQTQYDELQTWSTAAQQRITELEVSQASAAAQIEESDEELTRLGVKVDTFEMENNLLSDLTKSLEDQKGKLEKQVKDLSNQIAEEANSVALADMREKMSLLESELATMQSESQEVVDQWQARVLELEAGISQLEGELENQQKEASDVIEQWSSQCLQLEQKACDLESRIAEMTREKAELQTKLDSSDQENKKSLQSQIQKKEDEISNLREMHRNEIETLEAKQEAISREMNACQNEAELRKQESVDLAMRLVEAEASVASSADTLQKRISEFESLLQSEKVESMASVAKQEELVTVLENKVSSLAAEHEAASALWGNERESLLDQTVTLTELSEVHRQEIADLRSNVDNATFEKRQLEERIAERESEIIALQAELQQQQEEAKAVVDQWENHASMLEERNATLEEETQTAMENLSRAMEELKSTEDEIRSHVEQSVLYNAAELQKHMDNFAKQSEEVITQWQERVSELESTVSELEEQLETQQQEATEAIAAWQETCATLENADVESKREHTVLSQILIEALQAEIKNKEDVFSPFVDGYERVVAEETNNSPSEVIEALQSSMLKSNQLVTQAVDGLMSERESHMMTIKKLNERIEEQEKICDSLQEELVLLTIDKNRAESDMATLQSQLEEGLVELRSVKNALEEEQNTATTLKSKISALELAEEAKRELENRVDNDKNLIHTMKADLDAAKIQRCDLEAQLSKQQAALVASERSATQTKASLEGTENALSDLKSRFDSVFSEKSKLQEALQAERQLSQELKDNWNEEQVALNSVLTLKSNECMHLNEVIERLQEELEDVNDSLQGQITDDVSHRATEMATQALREQVMAMREQIDRDREELRKEKQALLCAQEEIARLEKDLAVLLRAESSGPGSGDRLRSLTMKATDTIQRNERKELEDLQKSLQRAMHELASSRREEKSASEMASSARLQASAFEQEVIAAKSDVAFLSQTMEEMRQAEAARIASFEYRVTALEDDRETLRRFHADELENVRNELAHVSMEKDRILGALKESEKTNAALLYTTSKQHETNPGSTPEAELAKLRVAHAQLLAAASDEGSRTERRIREAVSARLSSTEADLIVERELRLSAETTLESMRIQIEHMRQTKFSTLSPLKLTDSSQLERSKAELKKLSDQMVSLRREYEQSKAESKATIDDLTEKYRKAQAKAHKLGRELQFENDVNAEAARLRSPQSIDGHDIATWLVERDATNHEEKKDISGHSMSPSDAFDYIQQQKKAIQEERQMYHELLAEHDDLLALLAQQDLEKASLHAALSDAAGADAVAAAIKEAEENAVRQFGRYIQLA